jgi:hypothetical protein
MSLANTDIRTPGVWAADNVLACVNVVVVMLNVCLLQRGLAGVEIPGGGGGGL